MAIKKLDIQTGVRLGGLNKGLRKATDKIKDFSSSVPKIAGGVAIGNLLSGGIGKALSGIKSGLSSAFQIAVDTEQTEVAFGTLLGGADKAKQVLSELRDFGASTPFEFPELAEAGKKLLAFGFDSKSLVPQMRQLGDVASGLGIPFAELADLYGKAKVQGKLMSEDLNQLAGRGIPIFDELAKIMGVPAGEIKDLASKGKIQFSHLQTVMANLTNEGKSLADKFPDLGSLVTDVDGNFSINADGDLSGKLNKLAADGVPVFETLSASIGKPISEIKNLASQGKISGEQLATAFNSPMGSVGQFAGMMDAQSKTVGGLISTLKDNINLKLGEIGTKLIETFNIKERIAGFISAIQNIGPIVDAVLGWISSIKPVIEQTFSTLFAYWGFLADVVGGALSFVGSMLGGMIGGSFQSFIRGMVTGLAIVEFMFKNWRKVLQLGVVSAMASFVTFGNQLHHIFTVQIPTVVMWWAKNGFGIMKRFVQNAISLFKNLSNNIISLFKNLPGLISGSTSWSEILTPLSQGMQQVVQELPNIPTRVEGDLEKALRQDADRLRNSLTNDLSKHIETKLAVAFPEVKEEEAKKLELDGPKLPTLEIKNPDIAGGGDQKEVKRAKLAEIGSNEARATLLRSFGQGFKGPEKEKIDLAKQQLEVQKQQLAETRKQKQVKQQECETVLSIA